MAFSISGCIDSLTTSSDDSDTQNPSGIWLGTQTSVGVGAFDMKTVIYEGRLYGISEDAGVMYAGTYEMKDGGYMVSDGQNNSSTTYNLYDIYDNNNAFAIGVVGAGVKERDSIKGSFVNDAAQEGEISMLYTKLYEKSVSIDDIQGEWITSRQDITIDAVGNITGTLDSCVVDGDVFIPEEGKNLFEVNIALSGCSNAGYYEGLGFILEEEPGTAYFMALTANSDRMEAFGFLLNQSPVSFAVTAQSKKTDIRQPKNSEQKAPESSVYYFSTTHRGENHDGESFSGEDFHYNISDASYRNASFNKVSFAKAEVSSDYRLVATAATISSSDFSGSTFSDPEFGFYLFDTQTEVNSEIKDSDFSGASFISSIYYARLFFNAVNTDFRNTTFEKFIITNMDPESNQYSGSTINKSDVYLTKPGTLNDITFNDSNFVANKDGLILDNISFNDSRLEIYQDVSLKNITYSNTKVEAYVSKDFSGMNLAGVTLSLFPTGEYAHPVEYVGYYTGDFSGTNLSGTKIGIAPHFTNSTNIFMHYLSSSDDDEYRYVSSFVHESDFSKANFTNAEFVELAKYTNVDPNTPSFDDCDFTAANFSNADMSKAVFEDSDFSYANLNGASKASSLEFSYFGGAWWFDGGRCLPGSIGLCIPVPDALNTGLTYDQYLNGKDDMDILEQGIKDGLKDIVDTGAGFVEEVGSGASKLVKDIFGW